MNTKKEQIIYGLILLIFFCWLYFVIIRLITPESFLNNFFYFFSFNFFIQFFGFLKKIFFSILTIFWFFIFFVVAYFYGNLIVRKLNLRLTKSEKIFYSIAFGFLAIVYFTAIFGFCGLLYKLFFRIIFCILFLIAFANLIKKIKIYSAALVDYSKEIILKINIYQKIVILAVLPIVLVNILMSISPEIFYDSLVYHLSAPNYYIMHRKIVKIEYLMHSNFPLNQQMLNMLAMLLDTEILAKLIHCSMFIMSAIILFLTAKKFFSIDIALLSSIVFYAIPMLAFNSWTCGNDAALTFYFCLFLNAALNYLDSSDAKILAFCGLLAGACIAVKYTGIFSVSGLCAILVLFIILKKEKLKIKLKKLFWFFIFLIMPMMPWLIKNYIFVNNPIYPFLYSIFGDYQLKEFGGGGNIMNTPLNIFTFSFKKIFLVFWDNTNNEPIGIIFISLLPLIFLYLHKNKKLLILFLGFIISYFLWFLGTPQFRYILPCFAILSILIAYSFSELSNKIKSLYLLMAVLVIINFFCYNTALYKNIKIADYYLAKENKDEYLSKQRALYPVPPYPAIKWINDNLADTALILFIGESRPFYMQRKYISYSVENNRQPLIEYLKKSNNSGEFYDLLKLKKITHFLVNYKEAIRVNKGYDTFYWDDKDRKIFKEFWDNHIKLLYFKKSVYVYEIVEKNSDQKVDNLLEILSIYGWHNKILYDYFYSKNMYLNLIDELEVYQDAGFDCAQQIRYFKNQI